jgi:hypothetical protein
MANSVAIPQDIIDNVIAAVGYDKNLLRQCALVSYSFLLPSRKQLFSKIYLRGDQASQRLHQCLVQNPVIQSFVRKITITRCQSNSTSVLAILRIPFSCLESFSIDLWDFQAWNWDSFSSELKDALSNIIHSSTLKTLSLRRVVNVPINVFGIVHLMRLELDSLSPGHFNGERSSSLTVAVSNGVATTASHTEIDQCVWSFREPVRSLSTRFLTSPYLPTNSGHRNSH